MATAPVTLGDLQDARPQLAGLLSSRAPDVVALYVFGSTASGTANAESDVDLAILAERPLSADERLDLEGALADLLRAEVQLVDLRRADTVLQSQIVANGEVIVDGRRYARELFEVFVFSSYARLNEERDPILRQIAEEGRVYAPARDG